MLAQSQQSPGVGGSIADQSEPGLHESAGLGEHDFRNTVLATHACNASPIRCCLGSGEWRADARPDCFLYRISRPIAGDGLDVERVARKGLPGRFHADEKRCGSRSLFLPHCLFPLKSFRLHSPGFVGIVPRWFVGGSALSREIDALYLTTEARVQPFKKTLLPASRRSARSGIWRESRRDSKVVRGTLQDNKNRGLAVARPRLQELDRSACMLNHANSGFRAPLVRRRAAARAILARVVTFLNRSDAICDLCHINAVERRGRR